MGRKELKADVAVDPSEVGKVFSKDGAIARRRRGYRVREGQVALAMKIAGSCCNGTHLLAEAPPGTGKSFAYLVPAALRATKGECTVVVTANITLQEQLVNKDLPFIAEMVEEHTGRKVSYVLLKGMTNYACKAKIAELVAEGVEESWLDEISDWEADSECGDKSELEVEYHPRIWGAVSCTSDECPKKKCEFYEECWAFQARRSADIVVTNYHMLYTHFLLQEMTGGKAGMLPDFDLLVMDEAHEAVDIARSFRGFELSPRTINWLVSRVSKWQNKQVQAAVRSVRSCSEKFFDALAGGPTGSILKEPLGHDFGLSTALGNVAKALRAAPSKDDKKTERLSVLAAAALNRSLEVEELCFGSAGKFDEDSVYYLEKGVGGGMKACCKRMDVAGFFHRHIFYDKTLVAVSATLAPGGEFDFVANEMGLGAGDYSTYLGDSSFNPENTLLVVPPLPSPKEGAEHTAAVAEVVQLVSKRLMGRTMALFTSYKALNHVAREMRRMRGLTILVQGEYPKSKIIERFKKDSQSVILATSSFWQGVDIPGSALSCVIIDKLPFVPPTDPVLQYLDEKLNGGAFFEYSIPKAVISLKQGVGRLIRTETDFGVIVLCDKRVDTMGYGRQFLSAFPPGFLKSEDGHIEDVAAFIQEMEHQ